jgi:hypothetical protein
MDHARGVSVRPSRHALTCPQGAGSDGERLVHDALRFEVSVRSAKTPRRYPAHRRLLPSHGMGENEARATPAREVGSEVGGAAAGVGLSATLRLRIGAHDAHYAGELVDGAKCLQLFGDVATELLIRLDGDEGLFRAYDAVEFLAPVRAGDYLEVTGTITAVGRTSRKMRFEARKVIENVRGVAGVAPSAANVLDPPVVVCRASGTCVTPLECQRGSRETAASRPGAAVDEVDSGPRRDAT